MPPGVRPRLPRARGDGPHPQSAHPPPRGASPRSRGWTRRRPLQRRYARGFPALAGMDPRLGNPKMSAYGLPRARGDGPQPPPAAPRLVQASPRSRGWTPECASSRSCARGFPALAGMDPGWRRLTGACSWLPRARGDGPGRADPTCGDATASPRSRGWTPLRRWSAPIVPGFPALAGMDPRRHAPPSVCQGLPRARGDGPSAAACTTVGVSASPRSRGWTRWIVPITIGLVGFPALAGMDRARDAPRGGRRGLPRARGDGPRQGRRRLPPAPASPRSRGWTRRSDGGAGGLSGFPALAGMDPSPRCLQGCHRRLPRARGDGPRRWATTRASQPASPRSRGWT